MKYLLMFFFMAAISLTSLSAKEQVFTGKLDSKGRTIIKFALPDGKPFFLQGYVFYQKNWRAMKIFWNKKLIWTDMGPEFRSLKYQVHFYTP